GSITIDISAGIAHDSVGNANTAATQLVRNFDNEAPVITLTSLTGGSAQRGGSTVSITWTAATDAHLATNPISIEYSADSGTTWSSVVNGVANSGTFSWTLPIINSTTVRVRVSAVDTLSQKGSSSSTSDFAIDSTAPTLVISAPSASSVLVSSGTATFTVSYSGASTVNLQSSDLTLNATGGSSCTLTVTNGTTSSATVTLSSCLVAGGTIGFSIAAGTASDSVGNTSLGAGPSTTVNIISPALAWSPLTYDFGYVPSGGNSADKTFTLTNSGSASATGCGAATLSGTNANQFSIVTDTCGSSDLAQSTNCTVQVRAVATSVGLKTATLTRSCTVGGTVSTTANSIQATGAVPSLAWSPLTASAGTVAIGVNSLGLTFTQTNSGNIAATGCVAPSLTGTHASDYEIYSDNCGASPLGAGASCQVIVRAKPTVAGSRTATLSRACTFGGTTGVTANGMTVTGQIQLRWDGALDFKEVSLGSKSVAQPIRFQNQNGITLTGCNAATLSNTTDFEIVNDSCGTSSIDAHGVCEVSVRGKPQSTGLKQTNLSRTCGGQSAIQFSIPVTGVNAATPVTIVAGDEYSCLLRSDGGVQCWGLGKRLGNGNNDDQVIPTRVPGVNATQLAGGIGHVCALITDSTVKCWSENGSGRLGNGSSTFSFTPVSVLGVGGTGLLSGVSQIAVGGSNSCALVSGTIYCWGANNGMFGNGTTAASSTPIMGPTGFASISMGESTMCGIKTDHTLWCWGQNFNNQVGDGTTNARLSPVQISTGGIDVSSVAMGSAASCLVLADSAKTAMCWGLNNYGAVGNGTTSRVSSPVAIPGLTDVEEIYGGMPGGGLSTCARFTDQTLK
ncbi:MAG: choice-of-anchor D domain-containing protein, partial [Verrucomicrobiaceae bacterium]